LENNELTGTIPPELGRLSCLIHLFLSQNSLEGSLPPELASLPFLEILSVNNNCLCGEIPGGFRHSKSLNKLDLSENYFLEFEGEISSHWKMTNYNNALPHKSARNV